MLKLAYVLLALSTPALAGALACYDDCARICPWPQPDQACPVGCHFDAPPLPPPAAGCSAHLEIHHASRFVIDWEIPTTLRQSDALGCPGEPNSVTIQVAGILNRDFRILGASSECTLDSSASSADASGRMSTTLIYSGNCASDNDENFTILRNGSRQRAHITVDAGC
jgi:hypothetical protein